MKPGSTPATSTILKPIAPVRADGVTQRTRRATGAEFAGGPLEGSRGELRLASTQQPI